MSNPMRLLCGLLIVFAVYIATNFASTALLSQLFGMDCQLHFLSTSCQLQADEVSEKMNYIILLIFISVTISAVYLWARNSISYVFIMLMGGICLATIAYDLLMQAPVIHASNVINDTINILAAVIAASFSLILIIIRNENFKLTSLTKAVIISYAVKMVAVVFFIELSSHVYGATELFLLYIVYAFGAFTLHLMTICEFVAKIIPQQSSEVWA